MVFRTAPVARRTVRPRRPGTSTRNTINDRGRDDGREPGLATSHLLQRQHHRAPTAVAGSIRAIRRMLSSPASRKNQHRGDDSDDQRRVEGHRDAGVESPAGQQGQGDRYRRCDERRARSDSPPSGKAPRWMCR